MKEKNGQVARVEGGAVTPMTLLQQARESNASIDQLRELMELQFRWEANEARKAYNEAIAGFKAEGVKIAKDHQVRYKPKDKAEVNYRHATLGNVVEQVTPIMSKYGLSHTWDVKQDASGIEVTCKVAHILGHAETVSMKADADDSGGKNKIQQIGSTVTYLQRYTLLSALGLATYEDDDGKGAGGEKKPSLTEDQIHNIEALLLETGANREQFCVFMQVEKVEEIPPEKYNYAVKALETKRGK